jgi:excisionase family DNA binding protein
MHTVSDFSAREAAEVLGVEYRTVLRRIDGEKLEARRDETGAWRIPAHAIKQALGLKQNVLRDLEVLARAAGEVDAHWRIRYRKAVKDIGDAAAAIVALRDADPEALPDRDERWAPALDALIAAVERARASVAVAPVVQELLQRAHETARQADAAEKIRVETP